MFYCFGILEQLFDQILRNQFSGEIALGSMLFWFSRIYISRFDIAQRASMIAMIERFNAQSSAKARGKMRPIHRISVRRSPAVISE
jgi:hypothetical protein